jgi:hypothetical protein
MHALQARAHQPACAGASHQKHAGAGTSSKAAHTCRTFGCSSMHVQESPSRSSLCRQPSQSTRHAQETRPMKHACTGHPAKTACGGNLPTGLFLRCECHSPLLPSILLLLPVSLSKLTSSSRSSLLHAPSCGTPRMLHLARTSVLWLLGYTMIRYTLPPCADRPTAQQQHAVNRAVQRAATAIQRWCRRSGQHTLLAEPALHACSNPRCPTCPRNGIPPWDI